MAWLLAGLIVAQLLTLVGLLVLLRRLTLFETVVSLRLPLPGPSPAPRPPGPLVPGTGACAHPARSRVDASVLGRKQFLCLACDATVPLPKE